MRTPCAGPSRSGNDKEESGLLACWGAEQYRYDKRGRTANRKRIVVVFLETLSDGFTRPYLNSDTANCLHDRWLGCGPVWQVRLVDSAFAALRVGYLQRR